MQKLPTIALLALVLVMSACRAETNVTVDITGDGSGDVTVAVGIDDELMNLVSSFAGGDPLDLVPLPPDMGEIVETREADLTVYTTNQPFDDVTKLNGLLNQDGGGVTTFERLDVEVDENSGRLDATAAVPSISDVAGGTPLDGLPFGDIDDVLTANLYISMPGTPDPELTNADEITEDGKMMWRLPLDGSTINIVAVTSDTSGASQTWLWFVIGALGILAALIIVKRILDGRSDRSVETIQAIDAPPPPGDFDSLGS